MKAPDLKRICRKLGRDAAARGRDIGLALSMGITAEHRTWIRQGYDNYMARFSDRRAA
jgi:hypothetical protein